jgi:hypothetical protein
MKKFYLAALILLVLSFSSCVDVEERFDFHADGSCNVIYNFDMGKAVSVLVNLLADSVKQLPQFAMVKDTSLNFYSAMPDSIRNQMDSSQTAMAKSSDLIFMMNLKQNFLRASIRHSADNTDGLNYYLRNIASITSNGPLLEFVNNKSLKQVKNNQLFSGQNYYDYDITPHRFYRTVNTEKFKRYIKSNEGVINMSKAVLIEMPYKLTMNFPNTVKGTGNAKAKLSADKRSLTLETNIEETLKNPAIMNLKVDF